MAGSSKSYRNIFATDHATHHLGDNFKYEFRDIFTGNHSTTFNDNRATNNSPHRHISSWSQNELDTEARDGARCSTPRFEDALRHGADINASDEAGETLLHLATLPGHAKRLAAALDSNPNLRARNNMGKTPLDVARAKGRQDLVDMLEGHEAKHPSSHVQSVSAPDAEAECWRSHPSRLDDALDEFRLADAEDECWRNVPESHRADMISQEYRRRYDLVAAAADIHTCTGTKLIPGGCNACWYMRHS